MNTAISQTPGVLPSARTDLQESQQGTAARGNAPSPSLWVRFKNYRTRAEFEITYQLGTGNRNAEAALRDAYHKGVEIIRCAVLA